MLLKICIGLAAIIGVFLIYVALQPSRSVISREIAINATPAKVFPFLTNRTVANSWNPFLKRDTNAKITYEGPETGVGSATIWEGGKELGVGRATVTEIVPYEKVAVRLDYKKPFEMSQEAIYLLRQEGTQTIVTWKVEGESPFWIRAICVFINMEKEVGDTFSEGLAELKTQVEKEK